MTCSMRLHAYVFGQSVELKSSQCSENGNVMLVRHQRNRNGVGRIQIDAMHSAHKNVSQCDHNTIGTYFGLVSVSSSRRYRSTVRSAAQVATYVEPTLTLKT
jgi:hypothetical protein